MAFCDKKNANKSVFFFLFKIYRYGLQKIRLFYEPFAALNKAWQDGFIDTHIDIF